MSSVQALGKTRGNDLDDGNDEVLTASHPRGLTPEQEYAEALHKIKMREKGRVSVYTTPQFIEMKRRLIMVMGWDEAHNIMEKNV